MSITEFLTARYDEREAGLRWLLDVEHCDGFAVNRRDGSKVAWRVEDELADVAAKRAIVELAGRATEVDQQMLAAEGIVDTGPPYIGDAFLFALAQPLAEHPDFDPAWRVA